MSARWPGSNKLRQGFSLLPLALFFSLALLILPGDGNQGSVTGSCSCEKRFTSSTQIPSATLAFIRKQLKTFSRCSLFTRFQLQSGRIVCGGSQDQWVRDLVSCFERNECGNGHGKSFHHQKHLPHASTRIPEVTERTPLDTSTPAQIQSTQQSTFPSGILSLNNELTQHSETTTLTSGYGQEARPEAKANEKHQDDKQQEKPGAVAGTSALVPVLSLLVIVFLLTAVMVYVLCNRRRGTQQSSAALQLRYVPVNQQPSA